uniref:Uncharacterized protein n=1 Tax=Ditylenchus dipsaci TaxID=166011 RepID=A0A915E5J0_9BILA
MNVPCLTIPDILRHKPAILKAIEHGSSTKRSDPKSPLRRQSAPPSQSKWSASSGILSSSSLSLKWKQPPKSPSSSRSSGRSQPKEASRTP